MQYLNNHLTDNEFYLANTLFASLNISAGLFSSFMVPENLLQI
jgi:hypothetical protein